MSSLREAQAMNRSSIPDWLRRYFQTGPGDGALHYAVGTRRYFQTGPGAGALHHAVGTGRSFHGIGATGT